MNRNPRIKPELHRPSLMLRRFSLVCHGAQGRSSSPVLTTARYLRKAGCWPCAKSNAGWLLLTGRARCTPHLSFDYGDDAILIAVVR